MQYLVPQALYLFQAFGIHYLTVEDILMEDTREKCEIFDDYHFICIRSFEPRPTRIVLEPINFYIILARDFILTVLRAHLTQSILYFINVFFELVSLQRVLSCVQCVGENEKKQIHFRR
jgi:hypothetical protein